VCKGSLPADLSDKPSASTVNAVTTLLRGQVHHLDPRKMWPGGAFGSRGRIPAGEMPEVGRTLVFADAPEWRDTIASAFSRDAPAPADLLEGCVRMLSSWRTSWTARPEVVVDLPAAGFPLLTGSAADHLASVGRLERASLTVSAPSGDPREMSSAEEAAFWRDSLDASAVASAVAGRTVLLVVDATSSLWPVTVGSAVLRRSGASVVLPLLVHRRP
jgi:ATP-dependent DNA helicase RecQ